MFCIYILFFNNINNNKTIYIQSLIVIGTYLIQEGKTAMPINKETNNSTIEIFSGDVIQFGQGINILFIRDRQNLCLCHNQLYCMKVIDYCHISHFRYTRSNEKGS